MTEREKWEDAFRIAEDKWIQEGFPGFQEGEFSYQSIARFAFKAGWEAAKDKDDHE